MPLDPTLRVLLLAISRATRAFTDGDNSALKAVNESLQPLVDAAMARIMAKDTEIRRLTAELAAARTEVERVSEGYSALFFRIHDAAHILDAQIGSIGPETLEDAAARAVAVIEALKDELATARRGPVVEWRTRIDVEEATPGDFGLVVGEGGWTLEFFDKRGDAVQVDSGTETGDAGKAACFAAYLKAAGLA